VAATKPPSEAELLAVAIRELEEQIRAAADPCYLISRMVGVDQRDGTRFTFDHLADPLEPGEVVVEGNTVRPRDRTWRWQRWLAEKILASKRTITLKGRQIGATWVFLAVDVAEALLQPDTVSLLYRQREDEAVDNIRRWWTLYQSLPEHLKFGTTVVTPARGDRPGSSGIVLRHPDGRLSEVVPMTSAAASGHGRTVRRILLDEGAYIEKLAEIGAAVEPAAGKAAIGIVSTAKGRSNLETGEGNEFHRRWVDAEDAGYEAIFLPFDVHPDRDDDWYESAPEVRSLRVHQRQEQFPRDEHEAFALSDALFFDPDDLIEYRTRVRLPLYRMDFVEPADRSKLVLGATAFPARWDAETGYRPRPNKLGGNIRVYEEPVAGHRYAIGSDPATASGPDYSAAYVVDLAGMALVAEFRGKLSEDLFAAQLHYLGRTYGRDVPADPKDPSSRPGFAKLAVETQGGFGNAVIAALRDRTAGRPAYGNLHRNRLDNRPDLPTAKPYGFPMNSSTRPKVFNQISAAVRERTLPYVSDNLLHEMEDFIEADHGPSPRARDGAHDDCVMAAAICLEMYRLHGEHPHQRPLKARRRRMVGIGG
jgi:hypothetical protein